MKLRLSLEDWFRLPLTALGTVRLFRVPLPCPCRCKLNRFRLCPYCLCVFRMLTKYLTVTRFDASAYNCRRPDTRPAAIPKRMSSTRYLPAFMCAATAPARYVTVSASTRKGILFRALHTFCPCLVPHTLLPWPQHRSFAYEGTVVWPQC